MRTEASRHVARDAAAAILVFTLALAVVLPGLLPGQGASADTLKYQYLGTVLGISHAPGSPLYVLMTWLVSQLPVGELAWRMNLLSALMAAGAAVALFLAARELSGSRRAAFLAAAGLVVSGTFWAQSVVAELYTPHAALLLTSIWLLFRWRRTQRDGDLALAALLYGLSFGIHVMSWFVLPLWIAVTLLPPHSILRRPRACAWVAAGAAAGIATYGYYAIRPAMHPVYAEVHIYSLAAFLDYVTGGYFKRYMFAYDLRAMLGERAAWLAGIVRADLGVPVLVAAVVGVVTGRDGRAITGLVLSAILSAIYAMGYAVPDAEVYLLPAVFVSLLLASVGLGAAARAARAIASPGVRSAVLFIALLGLVAERWPAVARNHVLNDRSADLLTAARVARIFAMVPDGATVLTGGDEVFHALAYEVFARHASGRVGVTLRTTSADRCEDVHRAAGAALPSGAVFATSELVPCLEASRFVVTVHDFSETLVEHLARVRLGEVVLIAAAGEAVEGIPADTWQTLESLGLLSGLRGHAGASYAAIFWRTPQGWRGVQRATTGPASVTVAEGEDIADAGPAPSPIAIQSGGSSSGIAASIVADGIEYARPARGLQLVVLDGSTGTPIRRELFDTHETTRVRDFLFAEIRASKPGS